MSERAVVYERIEETIADEDVPDHAASLQTDVF